MYYGSMAEMLRNKRVVFPTGKQKKFLLDVHRVTGFSWYTLATIGDVTIRTLTDWKSEKYSLSFTAYKKFLKISRIAAPKHSEIRKAFWWAHDAARLGGKATHKKYGEIGSLKKRRNGWLRWWQTKGKFTHKEYFLVKSIVYPQKNEKLAEFVGIMLGDGSITPRQVGVTVNYKDDRVYSVFIKRLMHQLFGVIPTRSIQPKRGVTTIVISRTLLVTFCRSIGLVVGNKIKQQIDIPKWIFTKPIFKRACIRGLMDTDGCIFSECHTIKGKQYRYPRLSLVSASAPLRQAALRILNELDFSPKIRNNRSVQLERKEDIIRYFVLIQSHNAKHLRRWKSMNGEVA